MNELFRYLIILCMCLLLVSPIRGEVLFHDTYDRVNSTDIDSSSTGMSGILSPLVYQESFEGSGAATSIQILNNELNVAVGSGMSNLFLDHNFVDAAVLAIGGFSVTLEVTRITSANEENNRFGGFGVGLSRDDALLAGDINTGDVSFRGGYADAPGVADLFADLALDGYLRIWSDGMVLSSTNVGQSTGVITVEFYFNDFMAGSEVIAAIYFNNQPIDVVSFTWDYDNTNYIGISGRTPDAGVFLDNLHIETVYRRIVSDPTPADGASGINPQAVTLSWNKGLDEQGLPNAAVTQYYLYISNSSDFSGVDPIVVEDVQGTVNYLVTGLDWEMDVYWRVDQAVLVGDTPSGPGDIDTILGPVWRFDTNRSLLVKANGHPEHVLCDSPDGELRTAEFECGFMSTVTPVARWFKEGVGGDIEIVPSDDVLLDLEQINEGHYVSRLTINQVDQMDAGLYYCRIEAQASPSEVVYSYSAALGIKTMLAHWTMDQGDFVAGAYQDRSGKGHHAVAGIAPVGESFVPGVDPSETGQAVNLTGQEYAAAQAGTWATSYLTGEVTVSGWVKSALPVQDAGTAVISPSHLVSKWNLSIDDINKKLIFNVSGSPVLSADMPETDEWVHVAVACGQDESVLYINGAKSVQGSGISIDWSETDILLGASDVEAGQFINGFGFLLDDVCVFNYALDAREVARLFFDVLEIPQCLDLDATARLLDVAGGGPNGDEPDCQIGLDDFVLFIEHWMESGRYPAK